MLKSDIGLKTAVNDNEIAVIFSNNTTGNVIVRLNSNNYLAFVRNSEAIVKISGLDDGEYPFTVEYGGNSYYNPAKSNGTMIIKSQKIILEVSNVVKYYSGSERLTVRVFDDKNNPLENKSVLITINGNQYLRNTDNNGIASIALNLNGGSYNAGVVCGNTTANSTVTVKNTVESDNLVKIFKNSSQFYATFIDSEGNKLANREVQFNINGVFYYRNTTEEGMARLNINLIQGNYTITAINPLTGEMHSNYINILPLICENGDLVKYYRNSSQYTVRLIDENGEYKANASVTFNINGVFYQRSTNSTGHAKLNINLQPGNYVVTVDYNSCRVSNNIQILSLLSAVNLVKEYGSSAPFECRLANNYSNQPVTFNINGVFYNRQTDSDGIARLNINLQSGKYIITSSYNGDNIANMITIT